MIEIMISSSALILAVALVSCLLRGRISPHLKYGLWGLVALRLTAPWIYPLQLVFSEWRSRFSVMNAAETVHRQVIAGTALEPLADNVISGRVYMPEPGEIVGNPAVKVIQKAAGVDWQLWIMAVWILGSLVLFGYMTWVNLRFERELIRERKPYRGSLPEFVTRPVYVVKGLASPCYAGIGSGEAIYIPEWIADDEGKVRHALAHETGHVMHSDKLWGVVRCGLLCFYWTNPFVWLAAALSRRDCELSCDETAVRLLGEDERYAYGKTLVELIAARDRGQALFSVSTTMAAGKGAVRERICILVKHPKTTRIMALFVAVVVVLLAACTFSGGAENDAAPAGSSAPNIADAKEDLRSGDPGVNEPLLADTEGSMGIGQGDELVLIKESQSGNYYELTLQRRDAATGKALPAKSLLRPEADGLGISVKGFMDAAGTNPANGIDTGFGYSSVGTDDHVFQVHFWNVQGAACYRIELAEGEKRVTYQYETQDEIPVEISLLRGPVSGQHDTGAFIERIQVYSNAVWILMSGRTAEEAQRFCNENLIALQLEGEEQLYLPAAGGQDGRAINLLYQFEPGTFPNAVVKAVVTGNAHKDGWIMTELDGYRMSAVVQAFAEAYMSGDMDTARLYSTIPELDADPVIRRADGGNIQMTYSRDEEETENRARVSCRFMAEGENDSYTYLSMEVEKIEGVWKVVSAGFEK